LAGDDTKMKKAALAILALSILVSCSENYSKKSPPPPPPSSSREAKPVNKEAQEQPKEAGKVQEEDKDKKVE